MTTDMEVRATMEIRDVVYAWAMLRALRRYWFLRPHAHHGPDRGKGYRGLDPCRACDAAEAAGHDRGCPPCGCTADEACPSIWG